MSELPQIGHQRVSREGIGLVEEIVHAPPARNGLGYVFRELPVVDGGLDGTIEVIGTDTEPAAMTGRQVSVQVKSGFSYLEAYGAEHWTYRAEFREFEYWRAHSLPVLLLIVDPGARVVYWVRADDVAHTFLDASVAIRIPRAQTLGAASRDAIRQMAQQVTGAFDTLIEPVPVRLARRAIRDLAGGTPEQLAEAYLALANTSRQHGFRREACLAMARLAQYRWSADDLEGAANALIAGLELAVEDLRDPALARSIELRANTQPDGQARGERKLWTEPLTSETRNRLDAVRALAMALDGDIEFVDRLLEPHLQAKDADVPFEVKRVRAITLTLRDLSKASAQACEAAAASAPSAEARDALRIRAAWVRAMRAGVSADLTAEVQCGEAVVVAEAHRAAAWSALNAADLDAASSRFVSAAQASLRGHDVMRAVRAYRNAGRADFLSLRLRFDEERPDSVASRLETEARRQTGERVDLTHLDEEARDAASRQEWAAVRALGERLRIFGILEYDPTATQRGHTWLGVAWRAATRLQPDVDSLAMSIAYTAAAGTLADDAVRNDLTSIMALTAPRISEDHWCSLIAAPLEPGAGEGTFLTQLDAWQILAPHVPLSLAEGPAGDVLSRALAQPWRSSPVLDQRRKACDVVIAFDNRMSAVLSQRLLPRVPELLTDVPPQHHERAVHAASIILAAAPPTEAESHAIVVAVRAGLNNRWSTEWHRMAALGIQLLPYVDATAREALLAPVRVIAAGGDLIAVALLADAEPESFSTEAADAYLDRMRQLLDHHFSEIGGKVFRFGAGPQPALTQRAAEVGSAQLRLSTGQRAVAFVNETGHWRMARQDWLFFATQLARTSPALRSDVWQMLGDAAATGLVEAEHARALSTHPLSQVRSDVGGQEGAARYAMEILAWTEEWAPLTDLDLLVNALQRAVASPYGAVRTKAAHALGGRSTVDTPMATRLALRGHTAARALLQRLTREQDDAVRLAAYEAQDTSRDLPSSSE